MFTHHTIHIDFAQSPRWRKTLFISLTAALTMVCVTQVSKIAALAAVEKSTQASTVKRALALDPDNPALHYRLSQLEANSLDSSTLAEAVGEARRATALSPLKTEYWFSLASACETVRDDVCMGESLRRALTLAPTAPSDWWLAGNQYLRSGQTDAALRCFHRLLDLSPDYAEPVFNLAFRAYGDPELILQKIVGHRDDPALELAFAGFATANESYLTGHEAWTRIVNRGTGFPFDAVRPYVQNLLSSGRYDEARTVWRYLEQRDIVPAPLPGDQGELVFNGGFEQLPLDVQFDWSLQRSRYVSVDFADPRAFAGGHCLRLDFPVGENGEFEPLYQFISVVPNESYILSAYVRSSDLTSDSGPCLRVIDPACPHCLDACTEMTVGTSPWHRLNLKFTTGPQTHAARLSIWRPRSRTFPMEISGSFWLDSVSVHAERQAAPARN